MNGQPSLLLMTVALVFFHLGGIAGGAQSSEQPGYAPFYDPFYKPFYDPYHGSYYDPHSDPNVGAYDYDKALSDREVRAQILKDHAVTPFVDGDRMIPGAYDFDDELTDRELRAQIIRDLAISPFVDGERIILSVDKGVATLFGRVEDRSAMIAAVEIAYDAGARKVRNRLRPGSRDDRPWMDISDRALQEEIRNELSSSPFVNADRISVDVRNGVAILRGRVENPGEIADAVENAYEAGAKRVKSRLSASGNDRRTYSP